MQRRTKETLFGQAVILAGGVIVDFFSDIATFYIAIGVLIFALIGLLWMHFGPKDTRISTSIDPDKTEVSYYGPSGLMIAVFAKIESDVDIDAHLSHLSLVVEAGSRFGCRFLQFQPECSRGMVNRIDELIIPPRGYITGWFHFQNKDGIDTDKFKHFVLTVRGLGEPEQVLRFKLLSWEDAKSSNSLVKIV